MQLDASGWTGEGGFTAAAVDALTAIDGIDIVRLEDAPASRTEAGYAFISNEAFVTFRLERRPDPSGRTWFGWTPRRWVPAMNLATLADRLALADGIGPPDYQDAGMLQYLRTERIVAPYQTKGLKVVEMLRIYVTGTAPRR
jgi:hypothetical protein